MKTISNKKMETINGGEISCQQAGWLLGMGAFFTAIPVTAPAGLLMMTFGAGTLSFNDCPL